MPMNANLDLMDLLHFGNIVEALIQISLSFSSRIINVTHFQLRVEIQGSRSLLAISDARSFCTAERNVCFTSGCRRIYMGHASLYLIDKTKDARCIICED